MTDSKTQGLLDRLESLKDDLTHEFENLGLGKDALLRVHNAIDDAHAVIASHGPVQGHDLNVELAGDRPEDHPARLGQESTPINMDDNVNQASADGEVQYVVSGAPADAEESDDSERRLGKDDEPHAPQAA